VILLSSLLRKYYTVLEWYHLFISFRLRYHRVNALDFIIKNLLSWHSPQPRPCFLFGFIVLLRYLLLAPYLSKNRLYVVGIIAVPREKKGGLDSIRFGFKSLP